MKWWQALMTIGIAVIVVLSGLLGAVGLASDVVEGKALGGVFLGIAAMTLYAWALELHDLRRKGVW